MRKLLSVALLVVFVFSLAVPASAQEMIACDSTLLTLVLVAEYSYGFQSMHDLSTFEKGQLAPLFDGMMAMMEAMPEEEMMEEEMTEEAMMEEEMTEEAMMDDMMMLPHGDIAGEPEACTALRAEVEGFLYDHLSAEFMMEESM